MEFVVVGMPQYVKCIQLLFHFLFLKYIKLLGIFFTSSSLKMEDIHDQE